MKKYLIEGVLFDETNNIFTFNFNNDTANDLIKLVPEGPYQLVDYSPCTYFGYVFEDNLKPEIKKQFINLIKYPNQYIQETDLRRFIQRAVQKLDEKISLPKYDVLVHPQSSSQLNNKLINEIYKRSLSTKVTEIELIKDLPHNIEFNYDLYIDELKKKPGVNQQNIDQSVKSIEKMMANLKHLNYLKLGTHIKAKYRQYIKNFFKFKDNQTKKTFEALNGKNILIVDDVATTKSTLQYVLNTIRNVNDLCNISLFCVLGNKVK